MKATRQETIKCNAPKTHQLALFPTTRARESIYKGTSTRTLGNETYQDTRPRSGVWTQDPTSWRTPRSGPPDPDRDPGPLDRDPRTQIGTPDPGSRISDPRIQDLGPRTRVGTPGSRISDPRIHDLGPPDRGSRTPRQGDHPGEGQEWLRT